ncbi:MAG TPA: capsule assembly Wzi family protein [Terracidiphilus sp.]|nr:capsule assembly Wzi family protein [Terracidiphilus sp.]
MPDTGRPVPVCEPADLGSPYIPVDSWVYPAVLRLYGLGYIDTVYLGMRPWTRASVGRMLEQAAARIEDAQDSPDPTTAEAVQIYEALDYELHPEISGPCGMLKGHTRVESIYSMFRGIRGTPLRDSFHLGQTIINDYGRPYESGINNYTGFSGFASAGRFVLYLRGEFQGVPSASGYSSQLARTLSTIDQIPFLDPKTGQPYHQSTIPLGPIDSTIRIGLIEAYASAHVLNHEISFGRQDDWLGPGLGGGFAYSNNAANIYSFCINRIEPLHIPLLSSVTGPFRYEFVIGPLQGHAYIPNPAYPPGLPDVFNPGDPWMHIEKASFRPTENLEFGFQRTVIWGGKGHGPITMHTFLKSFFSFASPPGNQKFTREDPGARFGAFDFSYRLPFARKWLTLYSDGEVHDDVSPIDAPRRAAWRPGLYLSHVPGVPKLDIRAEAVSTDPPIVNSQGGGFMYRETVQREGYTNNGQIFGDWIGREAKGGQGWITYHFSGDEWIQIGLRNGKAAKDFIPGSTTEIDTATGGLIEGGTTINDVNLQVVKRIGKDFEINGNFTLEHWKAPVYLPGEQTVTATTFRLTWYPKGKVIF